MYQYSHHSDCWGKAFVIAWMSEYLNLKMLYGQVSLTFCVYDNGIQIVCESVGQKLSLRSLEREYREFLC